MKKEYEWVLGSTPPKIDDHTIVKHKIYKDYIVEYLKTLNGNMLIPSSKFVVVDAFAGGGEYVDNSGKLHPGSPITIFNAIEQGIKEVNEKRTKEFVLNYKLFLLEKNKNNLNYLNNNLKNSECADFVGKKVFIQQGVFVNEYKKIINTIHQDFGKKVRSIFILDQYGYKDVPFSVIREIFDLLPNSEIILTLSIDDITDYIPDLSKLKTSNEVDLFGNIAGSSQKSIKGIKSARKSISSIGLDVEVLAELKKSHPKSRHFIEKYISEQLVFYSQAKQYSPFFLSRKNSHKAMWLVHLANHPQATNVMKKLYHKYGNDNKTIVSHYGGAGLDMLGYNNKNDVKNIKGSLFDDIETYNFDNIAKLQSHTKLLEEIPRELHNNPSLFNKFYLQHSNHTPADKEMVRMAMEELLQGKEIIIDNRNPRKRVKDTDILSLNNQRKIYFNL
jgi:three-Cys-motif partner protein